MSRPLLDVLAGAVIAACVAWVVRAWLRGAFERGYWAGKRDIMDALEEEHR